MSWAPCTYRSTTSILSSASRKLRTSYLHQRPKQRFAQLAIARMNQRTLSTQVERVTDQLEKPELDDRSYRVIRLSNKLEALLVHDPDTDKASASCNVNVGSFSDADDMPGMAHAVEHLLFMGTKKFPKENEYSQYLSSHSGYSNAYTSSVETNYFFEVAASAENGTADSNSASTEPPLYGALDRFAQFFISPLFLAETLDRELRAVDSENTGNLQNDQWRFMQLKKTTSNPKHPYHHFGTGNLKSLRDEPLKKGVEIRKEFIDFHDRHYSANRMKVVVLGKEDLDTLEDWVSKLFSAVPNKDLERNRWDDAEPLSSEELLTQTFARPVMDSRSLSITFLYQDEEDLFEVQPGHYISHLIGHEGPGSVLAYIKAKGWATELSSGASPVCPGSSLFNVTVKLTEEGLANYTEITKVIFQYIALIKETPPQEWIVNEMKGLAEVGFRFKQKTPASSFTSTMSSTMQKPLPREWLLSGQRLIRRFDPVAIKKGLDCLTADSYRLFITSQQFPGGWDRKEKWYGTEFKLEKIPEQLQLELKNAITSTSAERISELHLPFKNEFIPNNLNVEKKEVEEPAKTPKLIRNDDKARLWWKKDDRFWVPKAAFMIRINSPYTSVTASDSVKIAVFADLVTDALVEYSYDAELAGLDYSVDDARYSLDIEVSGYNDKMHVLLEKVLQTIKSFEVKADRFKIIKEKLERSYRNWTMSQPYTQATSHAALLRHERGWTNEDLLTAISSISEEDIRAFHPKLLDQAFIEALAHGNLYKEDALRMMDLTESILKPRIYPVAQRNIRRNMIIPAGGDYTWRKVHADPAQLNSCIQYSLHVGPLDDNRLRALLTFFAQLTEEQAFDQLRTKEQLGYIVWSGMEVLSTTTAYRVIVQSKRSCSYLEERINAFLALAGRTIRDMSDTSFEGYRRSIINKRLEKPKNLDAEQNRFWHHILLQYYMFTQVDLDVAEIRTISRQEILEFFDTYISPTSSTRAKLSVHVVSQASASENASGLQPEDQKEKVINILVKHLVSSGISVQPEALASRLSAVSITGGDSAGLLTALKAFLSEEGKATGEQLETVLVDAGKIIAATLPSLGIEIKAEKDEEGQKLPEAPKVKPTIYIDDVQSWKASLALSAGAKPTVDLSTFEDTEPKL